MTNYDDADGCERNVRIFVRILPLESPCASCIRIDTARKVIEILRSCPTRYVTFIKHPFTIACFIQKIYVRCLQEMQPNRIAISREPSYWCFQTDGIFLDSSQEEVYRVSSEDLVTKILDGVSCVLIGHGQTGSGKSFTIGGLRNNWEVCDPWHCFASSRRRTRSDYVLFRSTEVWSRGSFPTCSRRGQIGRKSARYGIDISMVGIDTEEEALKMIFEGEVRRSFVKGSTYLASHLATAVITIHATNIGLITSWGVVTTAKIHIVEMAGIGSAGKNNCWKTPLDIGAANLTKSQLEQFFSYFSGTKPVAQGVIRSNNLLKILGDAFSVSSVIRFVSHIRITKEDINVTLSTLRFTANIVRLKPVKLKEDVSHRSDRITLRLRDEVDFLKKKLMLNDLFLRHEASTNVSKSRTEQINRSILLFLDGTISNFTLFGVSQVEVLLKNIKDLYNRLYHSC
ncbi:kinesin-like protein KIF9 [Hylaeus anthracinus]|uniref:kinesin-like protein KIF9 n=1 Tax=Hylaeus anthracinus TaxID=313031 RepID=UPI0023B9A200|nr:kinesin-like protein KIF9 [Hylaeus anthracinus]